MVEPKEIQSDERYELLIGQNRIGRFRISDGLLRISLGQLMDVLFQRVFIVRAEHLYHNHQIEYIGYSDLFKPNDSGSMPPYYEFVFDKQPDGTILIDVKIV